MPATIFPLSIQHFWSNLVLNHDSLLNLGCVSIGIRHKTDWCCTISERSHADYDFVFPKFGRSPTNAAYFAPFVHRISNWKQKSWSFQNIYKNVNNNNDRFKLISALSNTFMATKRRKSIWVIVHIGKCVKQTCYCWQNENALQINWLILFDEKGLSVDSELTKLLCLT